MFDDPQLRDRVTQRHQQAQAWAKLAASIQRFQGDMLKVGRIFGQWAQRARANQELVKRYGHAGPEVRAYHQAADAIEAKAKQMVDDAFERADVRLSMLQADMRGAKRYTVGCPFCYARRIEPVIPPGHPYPVLASMAGAYTCGRTWNVLDGGAARVGTDTCQARRQGITVDELRRRREWRAMMNARMPYFQTPMHAIITGISA